MAKQAEFIQIENNLYVLFQSIRDHVQEAWELSFTHDWADFPRIEVKWVPARYHCAATPESLHKFHAYVDNIIGNRDWEIVGKTMPELRNKLADGLEEYAEYLEQAGKFLRFKAKIHRMDAEYEIRRNERA